MDAQAWLTQGSPSSLHLLPDVTLEMVGWLLPFFQITKLRKSLDGRNGNGVRDYNRNNEYCQAEDIPKWEEHLPAILHLW